jgi:prepilin signal peptidase PulO-like enzyme (type II secretory pathway)
MHPFAALLGSFFLGTCAGSFVTLASHRLPQGKEIVFEPSHCPHCRTPLQAKNLVPLFSWIFQKGRCSHCHARISARYPLIELLLGLTFAAVVALYGVGAGALFFCLLATELMILIVTDLEHFIIPDSVQIAVLATGLAYQFYAKADVQDVAASMAFGLALGLVLHYGYRYVRKKDGLGFGDVKLLCIAGAWLTLTDFVPFLFFAGLMGTLTGIVWRLRERGAVFPFGPALAVSLFINILFPHLLQRTLL